MNRYITLLIILIAVAITSCNNTSNDQNNDVNIELNNGQKWDVNAEMKPFILDAEKLLLQSDGTEFKELADQLNEKNSGLIKSCTMDGKSHEELHKWLYPHMQLIKDLQAGPNQEEADKIIAELQTSFETYHNYFK